MAVIWLQLSVDVLRTICIILEVLEALAVRDIIGLEFNNRTIDPNALICGRDVNPVILPKILSISRGDRLAIHRNRPDVLAFIVNEEALRVVSVL